jgi:hypothetical protein
MTSGRSPVEVGDSLLESTQREGDVFARVGRREEWRLELVGVIIDTRTLHFVLQAGVFGEITMTSHVAVFVDAVERGSVAPTDLEASRTRNKYRNTVRHSPCRGEIETMSCETRTNCGGAGR